MGKKNGKEPEPFVGPPAYPRADKSADSLFRVIVGNHYHLAQMADNKAHIMITICSAVLALSVKELFEPVADNLTYATVTLMFFSLVALLFGVYCTMPKQPPPQKPNPEDPNFNVIFFSHFINLRYDEFERQMETLISDQRKINQALMKDLYAHGQVLENSKYRYLRHCYQTFMAGLILSPLVYGLTVLIQRK